MSDQWNYGEFGEISASQLMNQECDRPDYLVEPIIQRRGEIALVGASDAGKTAFLRQLVIAVCCGASTFLGFKLRAVHRRAIYVSTEDDEQSVAFLLWRQNQTLRLPPEHLAGLEYIFDTDKLVERLDRLLAKKPADVVVIDAFADIYQGAMNENNKVRGFLQEFSLLAHRHNCLIIFLHHTGKRTEDLIPSKHNAIGSQGFEAKMRLVIELRSDQSNPSTKHLCIVKGNYLPPELKRESFVLHFNENMVFEDTGRRVPFELLKRRTDDEEREKSKYEQAKALRDGGETLESIARQMGYKSKTSVINLFRKFSE